MFHVKHMGDEAKMMQGFDVIVVGLGQVLRHLGEEPVVLTFGVVLEHVHQALGAAREVVDRVPGKWT